jgi:RpiB/LacA/LacB family sugar-phosphate isomerase
MAKRIAIGADHGGYKLKEIIKEMLKKAKYKVQDMGTGTIDSCDYPEFGYKVAKQVSAKKADRGIVICRSGIGMTIIANKVPGVRAGNCSTVKEATSARGHNDTNVLSLAADKISTPKAKEIVEVWLKTKALKGRHAKRVNQIKKIEKKEFRKR